MQHMADFKESGQAELSAHDRRVHVVHKATKMQEIDCRYCGRVHETSRNMCPALNSECAKCDKEGHWAKVCHGRNSERNLKGKNHQDVARQKPGFKRHRENKRVSEINTAENRDEEQLFFDALDTKQVRTESFADIQVQIKGLPGTHTFHAKVDTGADGNILPARCLKKMPSSVQLSDVTVKITAYNETEILQKGSLQVNCFFNGKNSTQKFHVVDCDGPILMGLPACQELGLVHLNRNVHTLKTEGKKDVKAHEILTTEELIEEYPSQFEGLGKFPGTATIEIDPTVKPVVHAPRKCPIHLRDDLKKELDAMESMGVIKPVHEATDWVSSLVITKKPDGKLRICLDPKDLDKTIKRLHHRNITTEEITHQLTGATIFSKLDARSGYWVIELDDESSKLTTFNSPFGRYSFCRLPIGIRLSQDLFQRKMDEILDGLKGVLNIADDICVFGNDQAEHSQRLRALMRRAEETGLVFNRNKCTVGSDQVSFFGQVYSASGISPDPAKVDAIATLSVPRARPTFNPSWVCVPTCRHSYQDSQSLLTT